MSLIDGPTLRALRQQHQVSLREVARLSGFAHGHLSKVERGEPGRPVTPKVLASYEKATGVALTSSEPSQLPGGWQPGQLGDAARRVFTGRVAATAWGVPLDSGLDKVIATRCRLPLPTTVDPQQVSQLAEVADVLASLTGPMPGLVASAMLRWAVDLLDRAAPEPTRADLYAVVSRLAKRAAESAVEVGAHEVARNLQLAALHAASVAVTGGAADGPDLRAQVIADIATHLHALEHHPTSLEVVRLGELDERITDEARKRLHEVKTKAADAEQRLTAAVRHAIDPEAGGR